MGQPFGAQPDTPRAVGVADGINRLLQNLVLRCAQAEEVRDYFHVGVIGYGGGVDWALGGALAGRTLVPISELATQPLRIERRSRLSDDGAGGLVEQTFKFPVWFEPQAAGRTPMCQAITQACDALQTFLDRFPDCFPPAVLNITDASRTRTFASPTRTCAPARWPRTRWACPCLGRGTSPTSTRCATR
jgi:hypothetical protein